MRVLVVLSAILGVAIAGQVAIPLAYARTAHIALEPRHAFEYSSSVQTGDYANYASVRSDNAGVASVVQTIPTIQTAAAVYPTTYHAVAAAPAPIVAPIALVRAAEPAPIVEHVVEHATLIAAPATLALEKSQYHSQDSLGQAAYGHAEALQSHNAVQDAAGNKAGSYSYVAPDGRLLTTDYVADENGYRVATNALPIDPAHALVRRRRALAAIQVSSVPVVKEATSIEIAGHSSTHRLDTHNVNVVSAVHTVPTVYVAPHALSYAAYHPAAVSTAYLY